ncbi:MAG: aspartate kinase [Candidatus Paracaedibacteraceae bacterium]|nr:aspartate kinase [Candidatus Paracaedibacteraceae bacterium]
MSIVIQKYGGTSVGSVERMRHVADLIIAERNAGHKVAVVVSAMAGATNQLVKSANQFSNAPGTPAYDFIVSTGENVSCGMLALALAEKGVKAMPLSGWQVPIHTNNLYSKARIEKIHTLYIQKLLSDGIVPVVAGFQGLSHDHTITTLGRGGSDTSAVALAAALNAGRCDIYTDIDGIYTADPRVVVSAQFIPTISYSTALQMASLGTKIIHPRAVKSGMEFKVPLRILSSFGSDKFTALTDDLTNSGVVGISHIGESVILETDLSGPQTTLLHTILENLNHHDIPYDIINHTSKHLQLSVELSDESATKNILTNLGVAFIPHHYAKVSAVGNITKQNIDSAINAFNAANIFIYSNVHDNRRLTLFVPLNLMEAAINILHDTFFESATKKD